MKKRGDPRDLGPEDITVHTREGGPAVQLCGDSGVQMDQWRICPRIKVQTDIWVNSKNLTLMVEERSSHTDLEHQQFREARLQRT